MNIFSIPSLASSILFLLLGVFIFLNNRKSRVNLLFFLVCLATVWWQLSWFILFNSHDKFLVYFLVKFGYMGIIFIPVLFFHFFLYFLGDIKKLDKCFLYFSYLISFVFEIILTFTDTFVTDYYQYFWGFYPKAGLAHLFYLLFLTILFGRIIYLLFFHINHKDWKNKIDKHKHDQIKYLIWAMIFYGLASIDFLINYGVKIYPVGFIFITIFILFIAYAIIKSQFLNAKVITTQIFSISLVIASLVEVFSSSSLSELIGKGTVFFITLIFAILLMRSILREVNRREQMEILTKDLQKVTANLKKANDKIKRIDQSKLEFLSIASHQLRTPLTVIKGYVSMMLEGNFGPISKLISDNLNKIYNANERLIKLVENLLNISRIESGRLEFNIKPVNLSEIVASLLGEAKAKAENKKLKLSFSSDNNIKNILTDEQRIKEIITHLINNAVKYTDKGSIILTLRQEKGTVVFSCQDSGIGLASSDLPDLFNRFVYKNKNKTAMTESTGLSLYFSKMVIESMGGKIWVESAGLGRGSKFSFSLPVAGKPLVKKAKNNI
ncbi:MAG: ATP-binding protein [Candidatus Buchananbacteria bacterium]|nr:ATP-binding protein [Candidatus Buchananbacteria bacterium]